VLRLLPLFGVWLIVVVSPGPDFLVTVQQATSRSRRHGILTGLGVCSGLVIWSAGSMVGLSVLFARLSWVYDTVRYAGAAYLVYLGARTLWSTRRDGRGIGVAPQPSVRTGGLWRAWRIGFLTDLGNPKAAAFFSSLFGALLPAGTGPAVRVAVVAGIVGLATAWYVAVAVLFGLGPVATLYRRARRWIERVMATLLIALGGRLALDR
jgi:threonine/homoserine/homoserine lactone efflux protein